MEIRCSECGYVGPAAEVRPTGAGVALICGSCGHANELDVGASLSAGAAVGGNASSDGLDLSVSQVVARAQAEREPEEDWLSSDAMTQLLPEPGDGQRCRKCATLMAPDEAHCSRCGLGYADGARHAPGAAPWELPPMGSEQAHERMLLLWEAAREDWGAELAENFVLFARDEGLHDHAIRLLRFWLVENPGDAIAEGHLLELATQVQSRAVIARAQAQVSAKKFEEGVGKVRWALTAATILFWGAVIALVAGLFTGKVG